MTGKLLFHSNCPDRLFSFSSRWFTPSALLRSSLTPSLLLGSLTLSIPVFTPSHLSPPCPSFSEEEKPISAMRVALISPAGPHAASSGKLAASFTFPSVSSSLFFQALGYTQRFEERSQIPSSAESEGSELPQASLLKPFNFYLIYSSKYVRRFFRTAFQTVEPPQGEVLLKIGLSAPPPPPHFRTALSNSD